jgi:hypothetical protein
MRRNKDGRSKLANCMEHSSSSEGDSSSASQKIPWILWEPKAHEHAHKSLPPVPVLSQINPVHTPCPISYHFNIIPPSMPRPFSFSQVSPPEPFLHFSSAPTCNMPRLSYISWFDYPNNIWWIVQIMKFPIMQSSPVLWPLIRSDLRLQ